MWSVTIDPHTGAVADGPLCAYCLQTVSALREYGPNSGAVYPSEIAPANRDGCVNPAQYMVRGYSACEWHTLHPIGEG